MMWTIFAFVVWACLMTWALVVPIDSLPFKRRKRDRIEWHPYPDLAGTLENQKSMRTRADYLADLQKAIMHLTEVERDPEARVKIDQDKIKEDFEANEVSEYLLYNSGALQRLLRRREEMREHQEAVTVESVVADARRDVMRAADALTEYDRGLEGPVRREPRFRLTLAEKSWGTSSPSAIPPPPKGPGGVVTPGSNWPRLPVTKCWYHGYVHRSPDDCSVSGFTGDTWL